MAIPAVMAFNYFTGALERFQVEMSTRRRPSWSTFLSKRLDGDGACKSQAPDKLQSEINVTPLVDVVLVLLIIFMVVAPQLQAGPDVDRADDGPTADPDRRRPPDRRGPRAQTERSGSTTMRCRAEPVRRGDEARIAERFPGLACRDQGRRPGVRHGHANR